MRIDLNETVRPVPPIAIAHGCRADARFAPTCRAAFTLLELAIVLVIVSVVATMASLRYSGSLTRYRLDGASRRVIAEVARAQVEARTSSSTRTLRFSTAAATLSVLSDDDILNSRAGRVVSLANDPYRASMAVNGLAGNALTFDAYGDPSGGGIVTLSTGGLATGVTIDAATGRAYVLATP